MVLKVNEAVEAAKRLEFKPEEFKVYGRVSQIAVVDCFASLAMT